MKKIPKTKSGKGWMNGAVPQGLGGAVSLNLLSAGMIDKELRLGESPGRFAFPACPASRQPLFVLLALFPPSHSTTVPLRSNPPRPVN